MSTDVDRKLRREILIGRYVANPLTRALTSLRVMPREVIQIETTGRTTGEVRRVPLVAKFDDDGLWIIAQHGRRAGWVANLESNPDVRIKTGARWLPGRARVVDEDDVVARGKTFGRGPLTAKLTAAGLRALQTRPVSVRVDFA
jgi:deazaflavin-dependent oxidoreductase (nitroreductase family)